MDKPKYLLSRTGRNLNTTEIAKVPEGWSRDNEINKMTKRLLHKLDLHEIDNHTPESFRAIVESLKKYNFHPKHFTLQNIQRFIEKMEEMG